MYEVLDITYCSKCPGSKTLRVTGNFRFTRLYCLECQELVHQERFVLFDQADGESRVTLAKAS